MPPVVRAGFLAIALVCVLSAQVDRIVILKVDGLPGGLMEQLLDKNRKPGELTPLPWIQKVFADGGTRLGNFYSRSISLSTPAWSVLESGQHLRIRGNVEFDRYTLEVYDYLNFFPFYVNYALSHRVDMPAVEVLDDCGIPILLDYVPVQQRFQSFELFQRGVRWRTLQHGLQKRFTSRSIRDLFNEWETGFNFSNSVQEQLERELLAGMRDPNLRLLDYFTGEFDHTAHATFDPLAQRAALNNVDRLVGKTWTAIEDSPLRDRTVLVLVSDHGINSSEQIHSQGWSLVSFFTSNTGGNHHVMTNRHPLSEYKIVGLDPFVSRVVTPAKRSPYPGKDPEQYPTVLLDLDGNERASIHLRNSDLNLLQILFQELDGGKLKPEVREAAIREVQATLDRNRERWLAIERDLNQELEGVASVEKSLQAEVDDQPKKWTEQQRENGEDRQARRVLRRLTALREQRAAYRSYLEKLNELLKLDVTAIRSKTGRLTDLIPKRAQGENNSVYQLQNYIVDRSAGGLVLDANGNLDLAESFRHANYFKLIRGQRARNNVQPKVSAEPIDFIAMRIDPAEVQGAIPVTEHRVTDVIWLYEDEERELLLLASDEGNGPPWFRLVPIKKLRQDAQGKILFDAGSFAPGLPLKYFEDAQLAVEGDRAQWLGEWHSEQDWLVAAHRTAYSNALAALWEQLATTTQKCYGEDPLMVRYEERRRRQVEPDLVVFANDHWNFNVRNFNPGGNHGSLLRPSMHSVLMFWGGKETGIGQGNVVTEPYDALSFMPTLVELLGSTQGAVPLPGRTMTNVLKAHSASAYNENPAAFWRE